LPDCGVFGIARVLVAGGVGRFFRPSALADRGKHGPQIPARQIVRHMDAFRARLEFAPVRRYVSVTIS
jgi:hypothetical protein